MHEKSESTAFPFAPAITASLLAAVVATLILSGDSWYGPFKFLESSNTGFLFASAALFTVLYIFPLLIKTDPGPAGSHLAFALGALCFAPGLIASHAYTLQGWTQWAGTAAFVLVISQAAAAGLNLMGRRRYFTAALLLGGCFPVLWFSFYQFGLSGGTWIAFLSPFTVLYIGPGPASIVAWALVAVVLFLAVHLRGRVEKTS